MFEIIRAFLIVLEEGSLNRAATRLRVSQPALSRQMQALEQEIGGLLLERTSAGVRPTDAGYALAAAMKPVVTQYEAALGRVRTLARGQSDQLRIGYLVSMAQVYINPALAEVRRAHPEVKVTLLDLSPGEQIAALRRGEIDVAVIGQEGTVLGREFYTRKLAALPVLAVLPAGHPLAARETIPLEALRGERFLSAPEADMPGRNRWIAQLCRTAGFRPRFALEAESVAHMLSLILSEGAVTLVPAYMHDFPAAGIAMVPVTDPHARWDFLVVWHRGRTAGPLRVFLDALAAAAKESD
ncbi:MAG: LysR family transcriptional regulator [Chthoniobacteraceae bacterium]|nr:LysR family transcriptional regulator [Chthoniobacteraceae bacterium]